MENFITSILSEVHCIGLFVLVSLISSNEKRAWEHNLETISTWIDDFELRNTNFNLEI